MAGIYKRGKIYWARAQRKGNEYRTSLETTDRRTAQRRFDQWLERLEQQAWGERPRVSFAEAMRQFIIEHFPLLKPKSAKRYAQSLKWLSDQFGNSFIDEIGKESLNEFETARRSAGAASPTIRRDLACLSSLVTFCDDKEWVDEGWNPVKGYLKRRARRGLKEGDPRTRWFTHAEEAKLLAAVRKPMLKIAITLAIDSGLREQEMFSLTWPQIDFTNRLIRTTTDTKNRRARVVPLTERSAQFLAQIKPAPGAAVASLFVFRTKKTGRRIKNLYRGFIAAAKRASVKDATWHDLRRTAGCRWLQDHGMRIEKVSTLLGHSSIAVTERSYAFFDRERVASEAAQLPAHRTADNSA